MAAGVQDMLANVNKFLADWVPGWAGKEKYKKAYKRNRKNAAIMRGRAEMKSFGVASVGDKNQAVNAARHSFKVMELNRKKLGEINDGYLDGTHDLKKYFRYSISKYRKVKGTLSWYGIWPAINKQLGERQGGYLNYGFEKFWKYYKGSSEEKKAEIMSTFQRDRGQFIKALSRYDDWDNHERFDELLYLSMHKIAKNNKKVFDLLSNNLMQSDYDTRTGTLTVSLNTTAEEFNFLNKPANKKKIEAMFQEMYKKEKGKERNVNSLYLLRNGDPADGGNRSYASNPSPSSR